MEASHPMELLSDIRHVAQRGFFLNSDCLSLPRSEAVEEALPCSHPLCLPVWSLDGRFIVDLEHVLKVSPPSTGSILHSHFRWAQSSGMGAVARLELGVSLHCSRGNVVCCPSSPSRVTSGPASEAPSPGLLPSSVRVVRVRGRSGSV